MSRPFSFAVPHKRTYQTILGVKNAADSPKGKNTRRRAKCAETCETHTQTCKIHTKTARTRNTHDCSKHKKSPTTEARKKQNTQKHTGTRRSSEQARVRLKQFPNVEGGGALEQPYHGSPPMATPIAYNGDPNLHARYCKRSCHIFLILNVLTYFGTKGFCLRFSLAYSNANGVCHGL